MLKKMKGVVAMDSHNPYLLKDDQKIRFRHQSLLQDYEDLQKETDAMKTKLVNMKQKKLTLAAEVRFLMQRYEYLTKKQSLNQQPFKPNLTQSQKFEPKTTTTKKGKNYGKKEAGLDLNQKKRNLRNGKVEPPLGKKSLPSFNLNLKARTFMRKEEAATLQDSSMAFDLNEKEKIYYSGGKEEASKRSMAPVFDLNQISKEEEEFQANCEPLRKIEEAKEGFLLRSEVDEQHSILMISVCRDMGSGSSRAGKRKISWQDQVALRV